MVISGLAPPVTVMMSAVAPAPRCGTSQRRSSSGWATVAESPTVRRPGTKRLKPRQAERQQVAALGRDQRVQFVEHHIAQVGEEAARILRRDQQRELLGRGQQDVGRVELLALALVLRRVAGARLQRDRQAHLGDRLAEIALDVDGERLERRDVERVDAARGFAGAALRTRSRDRSAPAGSRPASCPLRSARSAAPTFPPARAQAGRAGGRAAPSPASQTSAGTARAAAPRRRRRRWSRASSHLRRIAASHRCKAKSGTKQDQAERRSMHLASAVRSAWCRNAAHQ